MDPRHDAPPGGWSNPIPPWMDAGADPAHAGQAGWADPRHGPYRTSAEAEQDGQPRDPAPASRARPGSALERLAARWRRVRAEAEADAARISPFPRAELIFLAIAMVWAACVTVYLSAFLVLLITSIQLPGPVPEWRSPCWPVAVCGKPPLNDLDT